MEGFHVLMYHEIIRKDDFDPNNDSKIKVQQDYHDVLPKHLFVFLEEFEKQMEHLHTNGYTTLNLRDLNDFFHNHKPIPEKSVLITFDDMYKSVLLYAYPVLKKYGFSAVGFVVLDWLFSKAQAYSPTQSVCLSIGELGQMTDVFEYANHSKALHTRKDGRTALQMADKASFQSDVKACGEFAGIKPAYAYPFGVFNGDIVQWLAELGFKLGFTTVGAKNTISTDPMQINRDAILLDCTIEHFKTILGR